MSEFTKIHFSEAELAAMANSEFFLTKKKITEKIYTLFSKCALELESIINTTPSLLPVTGKSVRPKITRGEKYEELPYFVLDYPRIFNTQNIFALRTIYHWGQGFSLHLILKGTYKKYYEQILLKNIKETKKELYLCMNESLWEHHFRNDNYIKLNDEEKLSLLFEKKTFIKIGVSLNHLSANEATDILAEECINMLSLLSEKKKFNSPTGEKVL